MADARLAKAQQLARLVEELTLATATAEDRADMAETKRALRRKPVGTAVLDGELVLINFQDSGVFIVKRDGAVCKVKMYGVPGKVAFANLDAALIDHRAKLRTVAVGGELEPEPSEHGWRIETAKTGRSTCRVCGQAIAEGTQRFGQDENNATWFHLGCAAEGAPRAFKPFAAKAAAPAPKPTRRKAAPALPPAKIVDELRRRPDDADTQHVFADWLQSHGDAWGELVALEHAGKTAEAKRLFRAHAADFGGGFGARVLFWRAGFLEAAHLAGKTARNVEAQIGQLVAIRTAVIVSELALDVRPDAALFTALSKLAPPSLRHLIANAGPGFEALALPQLSSLHVQLREPPRSFDGLVHARLPALRALSIHGKASSSGQLGTTAVLPAELVAELLASELVAQLEYLELDFGALDQAGARHVLDHHLQLAHLRGLGLGLGPGNARRAQLLFARQYAAMDKRFDALVEAAQSLRQY